MNYNNEIQGLLLKLPHELQVSFALYCAMDVSYLVPPKHKADADRCIDLVQRWLKGEQGLEDELRDAAYASAYYAAYAAAAYSAAAYSAYSAASAAYAAYYAAYYAANTAANTANTANTANRNSDKMKEYYEYLINLVREMPEIEKLMLNIEIDI